MKPRIVLGIITSIILATTIGLSPIVIQATFGVIMDAFGKNKATIATASENTYVVWWSNKTGDNEVLFRASIDGGQTFGDKINLSNSTGTESIDAEIAASGDSVFVTWWERNQTANEPVMKISNDNGKTFGPLLRLGANGTIVG
jgi:uncharacterized protein (UPF0333 family)